MRTQINQIQTKLVEKKNSMVLLQTTKVVENVERKNTKQCFRIICLLRSFKSTSEELRQSSLKVVLGETFQSYILCYTLIASNLRIATYFHLYVRSEIPKVG